MADTNNLLLPENEYVQYEQEPTPVSDTDTDGTPREHIHIKRLIVLCDGTGQASDAGKDGVPTNVTRFARALEGSDRYKDYDDNSPKEIPQIVLYQSGVGTEDMSALGGKWAEAFGSGVDEHILQAYTFFANNYESGDTLYIFGFSRGAFTARALASLICNAGLLKKDKIKFLPIIYHEYKKRRDTEDKRLDFINFLESRKADFVTHEEVVINILGLWDTVGSLGTPQTFISTGLNIVGMNHGLNEGYGYHDTSFPLVSAKENWKAHIWKAYQALALEECRTAFTPTLLYCKKKAYEDPMIGHGTEFQQVWFPGVHTDVGGGYARSFRDISDIALAWMIDICDGSGLLKFRDTSTLLGELKEKSVAALDPLNPPKDNQAPEPTRWGLSKEHDEFHTPTFVGAGWLTRTPGQYFLKMRDSEPYVTNESIHESVRFRMMNLEPKWQPPSLAGFTLGKDADGYFWEKTVKLDGGKEERVCLREWKADGDLSSELLEPKDREELDDEARMTSVQPAAEKGYTATLASAAGNAVVAPFKAIGSKISKLFGR